MKLKTKTLSNIISKITAKELDFLIYVLRFQNKFGAVHGLYYKDVCDSIKIGKSTFYKFIRSLREKNIICVDWNNEKVFHKFWNIRVRDNMFLNDSDLKDGYINLDTHFLYSDEFLNLNKHEKYLCLKILERFRPKTHWGNSMTLSFDTLMTWTGRKSFQLKSIIKSISSIFKDLDVIDNRIVIHFKDRILSPMRRRGDEVTVYRKHILSFILKAYKGHADQAAFNSVIALFTQYYKLNIKYIITAIIKCIKETGLLNPVYINRNINDLRRSDAPNLITLFS
jgi:hypothetical protein